MHAMPRVTILALLLVTGCDGGRETSGPVTPPASQSASQPESRPAVAAAAAAAAAAAGEAEGAGTQPAGPLRATVVRPGGAEREVETGPHFARARELFKGVPGTAHEVMAELELELKEHPRNHLALMLKATTQVGLEQFDAALATLDELAAIEPEIAMLNPRAIHLRAKCLYFKGQYEEAKKALEPFRAFFQGSSANKARYDDLMSAIEAKLPKAESGFD